MKTSEWIKHTAQLMAANPTVASEFARSGVRVDARETAAFTRQLEHLMSELFNVEYAPQEFRKFFPVKSTASTGAEEITYRQFERFGVAKKIGDYAGDLPHVNIQGVEFTNKIAPFGDAYVISLQDLRAAAMAGMPLDSEMVMTARDAMEQAFNEVALRGDSAAGLAGFLNHASIPSGAAVTGTWTGATGDQIYQDLLRGIQLVVNATYNKMRPNTILLPLARQETLLKARSADSDETVIGFFLRNNPGIEVMYTHELTTEAFFYAKSPRTGWVEIPQEFEQFPPQWNNLAYTVPCHGRIAGAIVPYPIAFYRMTGI